MLSNKQARLIAFYLPQFHPIPENDEWWEKGFTEWTNVTKAKPLYRGHHQPNLPADLGFYDLRVPETRISQADMAREYGIEGFCYWHYWFGHGRRILERPFHEVLRSKEPDYPFCLGWANHTWSGIWDGCPDRILIEQKYPGKADYEAHFNTILQALTDKRYMKLNGKPIFVVFAPEKLPDSIEFTRQWRELAIQAGFPGLYLIGMTSNLNWNPKKFGFDAFTLRSPNDYTRKIPTRLSRKVRNKILYLLSKTSLKDFSKQILAAPQVYEYKDVVKYGIPNVTHGDEFIPCILPNWDNTPRSGVNGVVFENSSPELFGEFLKKAIKTVSHKPSDEKIIFIKSWNEWAEGNYLEPDRKFGKAYLETIRQKIQLKYGRH